MIALALAGYAAIAVGLGFLLGRADRAQTVTPRAAEPNTVARLDVQA